MNKIGKFILMSVAASAVLWTPTTNAKDDPIFVAGQSAVTTWANDVSGKLNARFERARMPVRGYVPDGFAQVRFKVAEDGSPVDVQLIAPSGNGWIDRTALRSVTGLKGTQPLPGTVADDQVFQADFIYASDTSTYDRVARKREKANAHRMAANDRTVIALLVKRQGG